MQAVESSETCTLTEFQPRAEEHLNCVIETASRRDRQRLNAYAQRGEIRFTNRPPK